MKKILSLLSIICFYVPLFAKEELKYPVAEISSTLKENAHAIIRYSKSDLSILGLNKVKYYKQYAITILDKKGADEAKLALQYNLNEKIDDVVGTLYDSTGAVKKKMKMKDMKDYSAYAFSFVFYTDSRMKQFDFNYFNYPYTVYYNIERTINTTFFIPDWIPQPDKECEVNYAEFNLSFPKEIPVRYKEQLMPNSLIKSPEQTDGSGITTLSWKVKDVPAFYEQPGAQEGNFEVPTLILSPSNFEFMDHKGDMNTWNAIGKFVYELNKERDALPEQKKKEVQALIAGKTDIYDIIQTLYAYMQKTTRYVANEYGIAGWQTFDANDVAQNGYGDCKGLSNYMKALLKEAKIPAYTALVYAGENDYYKVDESFPANNFNHVIICVPQPKDSIWVECTSQQLPAGYLGGFTQGRKVLLVTENGGFLCETPKYGISQSSIIRSATLKLNTAEAQQSIKVNNIYTGPMQDDLAYILKTAQKSKINEMINTKFPFPSYSVSDYHFNFTKAGLIPQVEETADILVTGIVTNTQKRTFVSFGWMNNPMEDLYQTQARTAPLVLNQSFQITDSVTVDLPEGTQIESIPKEIDINKKFARFKVTFQKFPDHILMNRSYTQNAGVYKPEDYEDYQNMYRAINAGKGNMSVVILNKPS